MTQHNRETLLALADRAKKATGPDRNLDAMIHARNGIEGAGYHADAPGYTASLDAAMSLVPEGMQWALGSLYEEGPWAWCDTDENSRNNDLRYAKAATPALALCAAALRARATLDPTGEKA